MEMPLETPQWSPAPYVPTLAAPLGARQPQERAAGCAFLARFNPSEHTPPPGHAASCLPPPPPARPAHAAPSGGPATHTHTLASGMRAVCSTTSPTAPAANPLTGSSVPPSHTKQSLKEMQMPTRKNSNKARSKIAASRWWRSSEHVRPCSGGLCSVTHRTPSRCSMTE